MSDANDDDEAGPAPERAAEPADPDRRGVLIAAAVVGVLVVALLAWALTRDEGDQAEGDPAGSETSVGTGSSLAVGAVPTAAPSSGPAPDTLAPLTSSGPAISVPLTSAAPVLPTLPGATTATDSSAPDDADGEPGVVGSVVPDVAAFTQALSPTQERAETLALATAGRHDVAVSGPVRTLCAIVRLAGPIELAGRWERNGRQVQSTAASQVGAPGLGDCLDDDEGDPLDDGTYQFLVVDGDGNESAAGTIVVGAARVDQPLVNDGTRPICAVRVAPTTAGYYDAYRFDDAPVVPGATITLVLAAVEHDVRVTSCDAEPETVSTFRFTPAPSTSRPMIDPP